MDEEIIIDLPFHPDAEFLTRRDSMQLVQKLIIPLCILIWACTYFNEIRTQSVQDQMFIRPVFYLLVVLFVVNGINDFRRSAGSPESKNAKGDDKEAKKVIGFILLVIAYLLLVSYTGFIITSIIFLLTCLLLFGVRSKVLLAFMPLGVSLFLYVLFAIWFGVPLPEGLLDF
jgi:hypothetical protein